MSHPPDEGRILGGKYRVLSKLGEGGMGEVVLAMHTELDQKVAIKLLKPELANDPVALELLLREARAAARIVSDHVVRVSDVGRFEEDGNPYIVMEYLDGEDLSTVIERGAVPVREAVDYVLQACVAVAEAHRVGVIHRDLKPANLFRVQRRDGSSLIKVVDFGISKVAARGERAAEGGASAEVATGTPFYMSPEQLRGDPMADGRADVWALGIILFQLVTAETPFEAPSLPELFGRILSSPARRISEVRPDIAFPAGLEEIIDLCLAKDPKARFADAVDLAMALSPFAPRSNASAEEMPTKPPALEDRSRRSAVGVERSDADDAAPALPLATRGRWVLAAAGASVLIAGIVVALRLAGDDAKPAVTNAPPPSAVPVRPPPPLPPTAAASQDAPATTPLATLLSSAAPAPPLPLTGTRPAPAPAPTAPRPATQTPAPAATHDEFGGRK